MIELKKYAPKTLDEAISIIWKSLDPEETKAFKENEYYAFHHGFGTAIRNDWGLWTSSELLEWFKSQGIGHPDDMSGLILEGVKHKVMGDPFDWKSKVQYYKDYWRQNKIDPLTQKPILP